MKTLFAKFCVITAALVTVLYLGACTASEEAEQEEGGNQEAPAPTEPTAPTTMKKDTAEVKLVPPGVTEPAAPTAPMVLYAVQIGAYENDANAQRAEQLISARFTQPVRKYFDETTKLYKVSVGSFPTKDQALEFRKLLNEKYPGEYQDAWIVEVQK
jgi:cell division septation protein DedD